jgi:hypothetical protein
VTKSLTTLASRVFRLPSLLSARRAISLTHVEGANFPVLNGRTLDNHAHALGDHDLIEIAGVKMEFFFKR